MAFRVESDELTETHEINVTADGGADFPFTLTPRPAFLQVICNERDAYVLIDGTRGKSAGETEAAPIFIPMPKGTRKVHVDVQKPGFHQEQPDGQDVPLVAGQHASINIQLKPDH